MKKTLSLFREEQEKHMVMAFGRMNPPTVGHEKLVNKVHSTADKLGADHEVVLSHSQDSKKNPLTQEQKMKHAKRFFPKTNIVGASSKEPSIMHAAARYHKMGYKHLTVVAGADRAEHFEKTLHQYNGKFDKDGNGYHFKSIHVVSAGARDPDSEGTEGMSASKMRDHVKNNLFGNFKQGVPKHVSDKHAKEMFDDVRHGMKIHESLERELYMAGRLFQFKDLVEDLRTGETGTIVRRGTNHVTININGESRRRWLHEVHSLEQPNETTTRKSVSFKDFLTKD